MKKRGVIISSIAAVVILASCAMANETEPVEVSSAAPVMVPYLNKSITEVKEHGYARAEADVADGHSEKAEEPGREDGQDPDHSDDGQRTVLTNTGAMEKREDPEAVSELVEPEFEPDEPVGESEDPVLIYLGEWTTTAYCPCSECCGVWATGCTASGVLATPQHTVACGILPFGTQIMIDGVIYTVEDLGVDGEWVDIFFSSHDEALAYGMQTKSIYC